MASLLGELLDNCVKSKKDKAGFDNVVKVWRRYEFANDAAVAPLVNSVRVKFFNIVLSSCLKFFLEHRFITITFFI